MCVLPGVTLVATLAVCACATEVETPVEGGNGTTSAGGAHGGAGGATTNGGTAGSGVLGGAGGSAASVGGGSSTGGAVAAGGSGGGSAGTSSSGGSAGKGGSGGSSGSAGSGGTSGSGGTAGTGGTSGSGGSGGTGYQPVCNTQGFVFCDDFEDHTAGGGAAGWTTDGGSWTVFVDTGLPAGEQQVYRNTSTSDSGAKAGSTSYGDATIQARVKVTNFNSNSNSNAAGVYMRDNGSNAYNLALGGDGKVYLRRTLNSSTEIACASGTTNVVSGLTSPFENVWIGLKLQVSGTGASITLNGYIDTGSGFGSAVLSCTDPDSNTYEIATGTAGVFSKSGAPADYDDVMISTP